MEDIKTNWNNSEIFAKQILKETDKAALIEMPFDGNYKGYKFWMSNKLVRKGRNPHLASVAFTDDFTVKLFKEDKRDDGSFAKTDEKEISAIEFKEALKSVDTKIKEFRNSHKKDNKESTDNQDLNNDLEFDLNVNDLFG